MIPVCPLLLLLLPLQPPAPSVQLGIVALEVEERVFNTLGVDVAEGIVVTGFGAPDVGVIKAVSVFMIGEGVSCEEAMAANVHASSSSADGARAEAVASGRRWGVARGDLRILLESMSRGCRMYAWSG